MQEDLKLDIPHFVFRVFKRLGDKIARLEFSDRVFGL